MTSNNPQILKDLSPTDYTDICSNSIDEASMAMNDGVNSSNSLKSIETLQLPYKPYNITEIIFIRSINYCQIKRIMKNM